MSMSTTSAQWASLVREDGGAFMRIVREFADMPAVDLSAAAYQALWRLCDTDAILSEDARIVRAVITELHQRAKR